VSETEAWLQLADLASGKTYSPVVPMTPRSERPRSREFVAARRAKQLERTQAHSATLLVALLASGCTRRPPNRTRARTNRTGHGLRWRRRRKGSGLFGWGAAPVAPKAPKRRTRLRWPRGSAASAPPRHSLSPSLGNGGAAFPLNCRSTVTSLPRPGTAFLLLWETVEPLSL
jgi:hypothetical protein